MAADVRAVVGVADGRHLTKQRVAGVLVGVADGRELLAAAIPVGAFDPRRLDTGEAGLRETLDLVKEGRGLVEYCAGELDAVSQGLEELHLDELVARLEAQGAGTPADEETTR